MGFGHAARRLGLALLLTIAVLAIGCRVNAPVVPTRTFALSPISTTLSPSYDMVAADGGIFTFGNAGFWGSMGGTTLNKPIVGMAATPDGQGYWLVAADGGIFTFGNAPFYGSMGGTTLNKPVVGMAADPVTGGYWLVASDGGVFSFNAPFYGSMGGTTLNKPVVGIAQTYSMNPYSTGMYGADISWPQCPDSPLNPITQFPANNGVGVVGATSVSARVPVGSAFPTWSEAFATNPCLGSEFKMAQAAGAHVSLYTVLWSPSAPSSGDTQLFSGPEGTCASTAPLTSTAALDCQAYDWGYNIALAALSYSSAQGAYSNLWWLDVELPGNGNVLFGTDTTANDNVISGAVYALKTLGYQVGIYSSKYQFASIAGSGYSPGAPIWIATANTVSSLPSYCTSSSSFFGGGTPWLIQGAAIPITPNASSYVDPDYAC